MKSDMESLAKMNISLQNKTKGVKIAFYAETSDAVVKGQQSEVLTRNDLDSINNSLQDER